MKGKTYCAILALSLLFIFFLSGCGKMEPGSAGKESPADAAATKEKKDTEETKEKKDPDVKDDEGTEWTSFVEQFGSKTYYIPELQGTISVPKEYSVFGKDIYYTDEMCYEAGVNPSNMAQYLSLAFDQAYIIPRGDKFTDPSIEICLKVKEDKYGHVDFGSLSETEYKLYADELVAEFSADSYSTLKKNGMRFVVFDWNEPTGNTSYRYATIIDGDMIYIYASVTDSAITPEQRVLLESIATSIDRG